MRRSPLALLAALALAGCHKEAATCSLDDPHNTCDSGKLCEEVAGGVPACAEPLVVRGRVTDGALAPIAGALVTAVDANDAPTTLTVKTAADGGYELPIATPRTAAGTPSPRAVKLHVAASGFTPYPSGIR